MDTCVLIPRDLSIILQPTGAHSLEMGVTLWANRRLTPGVVFRSDEGEIQLDTLEVYTPLKRKDVRYRFGCYDDVLDIDQQEVRHCNWVRFLQSSPDMAEVNMVATQVKGQVLFEIVKEVPPNGEIKVFFDCDERENLSVQQEVDEDEEIEVEELDEEDEEEEEVSIRSSSSEYDSFQSPASDRLMTSSDGIGASFMSPEERGYHFSPVSDVSADSRSSSISESKPTSSPEHSLSHNGSSSAFSPPNLNSPDCDSSSPFSGNGEPRTPLLQHTRQVASLQQYPVRRKEKSWLPCAVCGKTFDRPSLLKRHMRTHTGEKPHGCDVCGKAFSTSSSLNTHRRIHSGEKPHECQTCGKRFTASSNLYYHRMTHKKDKPHKCTMCSKSFPTPGDLKSHMYVHNGSWPFKCDICNRGFSKQTNLKNHMLLHTGDKPHSCHICNKKFAMQCNLRTHLKTHDDDQLDHCVRCNKSVTSKVLLFNGLCSECGRSPQSRHVSPFSVESLVSPRKDEVFKMAANIGTSSPEVARHPYYAGAMMSAGIIPVNHGNGAMMNYGIGSHVWQTQLAQRYRI